MRVMAVRTVLGDRLMGVYERTALLHVAGVAGLVHAIALHELRPDRTVRIVAIAAAHLAFGYRVMRGLADLRALFLVAGEAHIWLGVLIAHVVVCGVNLVAGDAGDIATLVRAAHPVRSLRIRLVAGEAGRVAIVHRRYVL